MTFSLTHLAAAALVAGAAMTTAAQASCTDLPSHDAFSKALQSAVKSTGGPSNGGFDLGVWATLIDRDGTVCAVAKSGNGYGSPWQEYRLVSARKANTANAFSRDSMALSTANIYSPVQTVGSLPAGQQPTPVALSAMTGDEAAYGTARDAMVGQRALGVNAFGGGLALYSGGRKVGAIGIAGDTSCADHNVAWRVRSALGLGQVPGGVSAQRDDGIIFDIEGRTSRGGFGHPLCGGTEADVARSIKSGG